MPGIPFCGQRTQMTREEAIEGYILLRLRFEDIKRLAFLVENLHAKTIQLPSGSPFTHADLKDTARTAFFGWFATLTDKDGRAIYAFDPLFVLFPHQLHRIGLVQMECEACHSVLHQFRSNVAFHGRAEVAAQIKARQALRGEDTFLDLESARQDFRQLMTELIAEELSAIPELPQKLADLGVFRHPAFANVASAVGSRLCVLELRRAGIRDATRQCSNGTDKRNQAHRHISLANARQGIRHRKWQSEGFNSAVQMKLIWAYHHYFGNGLVKKCTACLPPKLAARSV